MHDTWLESPCWTSPDLQTVLTGPHADAKTILGPDAFRCMETSQGYLQNQETTVSQHQMCHVVAPPGSHKEADRP